MALKGPVDPEVFVAWLRLLRDRAWPGPVYERRDIYPWRARNEITQDFLNGPADSLFMFDSDQVPPLLCLDQGRVRSMVDILEDAREPIVCGLVYMRQPPYEPVAYSIEKGKHRFLTPGAMQRILASRAMVEVDSYGSGSMLVQRRVFEHLAAHKDPRPIWEADPAFDYDEGWKFCSEVRALGYRLWLDSRIEAAHVAHVPITSTDYFRAHGYQRAD